MGNREQITGDRLQGKTKGKGEEERKSLHLLAATKPILIPTLVSVPCNLFPVPHLAGATYFCV